MEWLTKELRQKIRQHFEPKYKRVLSEAEVEEIADNLSEVVEIILKFKWRQKYERLIAGNIKDDQKDGKQVS